MVKKSFYFLVLTFSSLTFGQFGFERSMSIESFKDGDVQTFAWAGGMDYCQFSNIDLNFDGVQDLFVFDRTCNKTMTFLQMGGEGEIDYVYAPEYEADFPADLHDWALLVDYNCDGKQDIFTYALGGARVFLNTGSAGTGNTFSLVNTLLKTTIYGSLTYMYLSSPDIPAIVDVDGDGDSDILGFGVLGTALEYHKNLSVETYGTCDSLVFETKNICWGRFREDAASNDVTLWDTLVYPCRDIDLGDEMPVHPIDHDDRHAGSSVLALDLDDSGVLDLILGDISYNNLTMLLNSGTEVNSNSGMYLQDNAFPSTSFPVDLAIFPAAYHVDVNNDGKRDLIVSPNSKVGSENRLGVWLYINEGTGTMPDFVFQQKDFLQGDMIESGTSSLPVFFDHNGDGLLDLLVSSQGQYDPVSNNQICKIAYYENIGSATAPIYEFITDDYQGLSTKGIGASLVFYPAFGDLDGDGDEDMILGEYEGYCYYMENTGGAGSPAIFNTFSTLLNSEGGLIFDGTYAYPNLVDLDRDGDKDLVIGRRTGKLQYFENTGVGTYNFEFVTSNLGNVNVADPGTSQGHAITQFVDLDGEYQLLVGCKRGFIYYFDAIEANMEGSFHLVDSIVDDVMIGTYAAPAIANLNDDNRLELVLGNRRGGVGLFRSAPTTNIGLPTLNLTDAFKIYPNPAQNTVALDLGTITANELETCSIVLYSVRGELIKTIKPTANITQISVDNWDKGTYLVQVISGENTFYQKLVIQ
jgi:hypothetical protein